MDIAEFEYLELEENKDYEKIVNRVIEKCFEIENLISKQLYVSITFVTPKIIREINLKYRNIDKETDVLSFPMFEKDEIKNISGEVRDVLGDIIISISKVEEQAKEFGHSFERELAYMVVHGFYHLMGYDHIAEEDKLIMREREENILRSTFNFKVKLFLILIVANLTKFI